MPITAPDFSTYDPARRRYYLLGTDSSRNPSDYEVLNLDDLFADTGSSDRNLLWFRGGVRKYVVKGRTVETSYGLPQYLNRPKVKVALKNKPLDIYGFGTRRVVSSRAKQLLCEIDPDAFDFEECETVSRQSVHVDPYWVMDTARIVENFDEARSVFETAKSFDGVTGEPFDSPPIANLHDIHMSPDLPAHHHAFVLSQYRASFIFDDVLADEWRKRKFSGADFAPLQPPTPEERKKKAPYVPHWWGWYRGFETLIGT